MEQYNYFRHLSDFTDQKLALYIATQEAYYKLMQHLEKHGFLWGGRMPPTKHQYFGKYKNLVIYCDPDTYPKRLKYKDRESYTRQIVEFKEWED